MRPVAGTYRGRPEDFRVDEVVPPRAEQEGEHLHVRIEKRGLTTDAAVRRLARALGVKPGAVGRCGRKDRHAVTTQWLSLPRVDRASAEGLDLDGVRVLESVRLPRKLRMGRFLGNRFTLRVREVDPACTPSVEARLAELVRRGLPNAFGPQRYGRRGDNADVGALLVRGEREKALALLAEREPGSRPPDRRALAFHVAALQARVFDRVLAARGEAYDQALEGDLLHLHASGRTVPFAALGGLEEAAARVAALELSPTGPLVGPRAPEPAGAALALEREVLAACELPAPAHADWLGLPGARRPLRVPVTEARAEAGADDAGPYLELAFRLPPGAYATTLLDAVSAGGFRSAY